MCVFFDVSEFAQLRVCLDLNRSLNFVVDVCQYFHKESAASRENPQQMVLATKLLSQEQSREEFLARTQDQLLSIGTVVGAFRVFNVVQSGKFNHHLREKGEEEKLESPVATSPQVVRQQHPHLSINSKLAGPKIFQKKELLTEPCGA